MSSDPIYVDNTLFLGRIEEQKQFRAAITEVLHEPEGEDLPYILLLYGDGGMGKTTLAKRFRDIAQLEQPFESEFQILWIDWETERRNSDNVELKVGPENIRPETIFDVIHAHAIDAKWGRYFSAYQEIIKKRSEVEKKVAEVLASGDEQDEFAGLRGVYADGIAKILRLRFPEIGKAGEDIAKAFLEVGIKVGAEQAGRLRVRLENRLRARLDSKQYDLFLKPNEQLARALGEGLKKTGDYKPLIVFLDTYEIVDHVDFWLRMIMSNAGPRVIWVVAGRNDLVKSRPFNTEYFTGYADEFPRRLIDWDMRQLAEQDILALFTDRAPNRPLSDDDVHIIRRVTLGVPLALKEAAEMWEKGIDIREIVGDPSEPILRKDIVKKMTARYLMHAVKEVDRYALYALVLARGNVDILRAMLRPADGSPFDMDALLRHLERDYASVHYEYLRLHDEPTFFIEAFLRNEIHRTEDRVKNLNRQAVETLQVHLKELEVELPCLEDRCQNSDWKNLMLALVNYLFWVDENLAWRTLIPHFVEGVAYDHSFAEKLIEVAKNWEDCLGEIGRKRVSILHGGDHTYWMFLDVFDDRILTSDAIKELLNLDALNWFKGEKEAEYSAILAWQYGNSLCNSGNYSDALVQFERAAHSIPSNSNIMKKELGSSLSRLISSSSGKNRIGEIFSHNITILSQLGVLFPEVSDGWCRAGENLEKGGNLPDAIAAYNQAIEISPDNIPAYYKLGNLCEKCGYLSDAIVIYKHLVEIQPEDKQAYYHLGNLYKESGSLSDAITVYEHLIEVSPDDIDAYYQFSHFLYDVDQYDDAIAIGCQAIEVDPAYSPIYINLGLAYSCLGKYDDAITTLQSAIANCPKDYSVYALYAVLGMIHSYAGQYDESIANLQHAVSCC